MSESSSDSDNTPLKQMRDEVGVDESSDEGGMASGAGVRKETTVIIAPEFRELNVRDTIVEYGGADGEFDPAGIWLSRITKLYRRGAKKGLMDVDYYMPDSSDSYDGSWTQP